jgi:hypothetical protein
MPRTARNHNSASCGEALARYLNATAGLPDVGLHDLYPAFDQGLIGCEQGAKLVVLFTRLQDLLAALWGSTESARIRQCTCGCGKWFFAHRKDQRFLNENCRRKAHVSTTEQKEHRRAYMGPYMKKYYAQNFSTLSSTVRPTHRAVIS